MDSLRLGFLGAVAPCKSGVRAKFGVNMGSMEEFELSRLVKEKRTGPGWKHSRQKLLRRTIVGLHLLVHSPIKIVELHPIFFSSTEEEVFKNLLLQ